MLVLIDNANLKEIESLYDMYPYDGVTTNPTILKNEHTNPIQLLKDIRSLLPAESQLHAQVISDTTDGIMEEAHFMLNEIAEDLFIKVPVSAAGMKAIHLLKREGAVSYTHLLVMHCRIGNIMWCWWMKRSDIE